MYEYDDIIMLYCDIISCIVWRLLVIGWFMNDPLIVSINKGITSHLLLMAASSSIIIST